MKKRPFDPAWEILVGRYGWITCGWYRRFLWPRVPFRLFRLSLVKVLRDDEGAIEEVTLIDIQFLRGAFAVGFNTTPDKDYDEHED